MGADLKAKLSLSTADYDRARARVKHGNAEMGFGFKELQGRLTQMFTVGFVLEFAQTLLEAANRITNLSEQLEVSTTTAQTWDIALKENGQNAEKLAMAITHIAEARKKALLGEPGGDEALAAFSFFGVKGEGLKESPVDILRAISDQMSKTARTTRELTDLGTLIGPKIATSLRVTLGEGLTDIEKKYTNSMQVMSDKTVKEIHRMEQAWGALKRTATAEGAKAFVGMADSHNALMDIISWHPHETNGVWNPIQRLIEHMVDNSNDPEGEAGVEDKRKRLTEAQQKRANKAQTKKEIDAAKAIASPRPAHHDPATNLVRLGNFAFTRGGANPMETTLTRSMQIQQKIEQNTRPNKSVGGGGSSVP
jgi:hypothetical protein